MQRPTSTRGTNAGASPPSFRLYTHFVFLFHIQVTFVLMTLTLGLIPSLAASHESTDTPPLPAPSGGESNVTNFSYALTNQSDNASGDLAPPSNVTLVAGPDPAVKNSNKGVMHKTMTSPGSDIPREFPTALVIASSIAAVCILVFFVASYFWHTHQLDSRARKLAIRLAADSEHGARCQTCTPRRQVEYRRAASESSQEQNNHYEILMTTEEERFGGGDGGGPGSDGGRSSVGVSESEAGDSEDLFEPSLPPILPTDRGRGLVGGGGGVGAGAGARGGRGAHRKFSRSRKTSGGSSMEKRDSAVTDKEILTHFASRRHSTFFI